jgi:Cu2+-exporting ATPase
MEAVDQLRQRGLKVSVLSGDPSPGAAQILKPLGLSDCQLSLQPQQKLTAVRDLQQRGTKVLMVGDGINDVPVLQAADVSVALGQASDLSQIHADVTLLSGDLRALPEAIATATQTRRIIKQNIIWAIAYNLVALPLAAAGYVPPWAAAIGMSASSLLVMLNALRLARGAKLL